MIKTLNYKFYEVAPYINWVYFFHAWGFAAKFARIAHIHGCDACRASWLAQFPERERPKAAEAMQLFKEAQRLLKENEDIFEVHAQFGLYECNSNDDDLIVYTGKTSEGGLQSIVRIPLLRQQYPEQPDAPCLCLSDFLRPINNEGQRDTLGVFVGTVDEAFEHLFENGPYADAYKHLLAQTLADRLAEAGVERMHEEVRRNYWGYASNEKLTPSELHANKFCGIRPAIGYPSLPDQSTIFELKELLRFNEVGVMLTENGAMRPHASVCGLMISHPMARYFSVGKIGEDQLQEYSKRKSKEKETITKFLSPNIINSLI